MNDRSCVRIAPRKNIDLAVAQVLLNEPLILLFPSGYDTVMGIRCFVYNMFRQKL